MDSESLRTVQLLELKILLHIDKICKEHNIPYFIHSGTLLGAVRHHGFIPWDDDVDIGMKREHYEYFIEICKKNLGDEYLLQTSTTDEGYMLPFLKIRLKGTSVSSIVDDGIIENNGVFIDVFPFDYVPDNIILRQFQRKLFGLLNFTLIKKYNYNLSDKMTMEKIVEPFVIILAYLPRRFLFSFREKVMTMFNNHHSNYCVNWPFYEKSSKLLEGTVTQEFETFMFPSPKYWKEYLGELYGDYMQLPPENQRHSHSLYSPEFGRYSYVKSIDDITK